MRPVTVPPWVTRHGATVVGMAVGGAIVVVGSLLPWVRTGQRRRHSYDLFAVVDRLGLDPGGAAEQALRWWPLVPLLTAAAVVTAWWGWRRVGGVLGAVAGAYAGGIGLVMARVDARRIIDVQIGPAITAFGGAVLLLGGLATLVVSHPGRTRPTDLAP